jgi:hypothetical protein
MTHSITPKGVLTFLFTDLENSTHSGRTTRLRCARPPPGMMRWCVR